MFQSIWEDVKREFSQGNMVTRIIIINIMVFIAINLVWIVFRITNEWQDSPTFDTIQHFFMISSDWKHNLTHPWVLITTMFFHTGFWHILWNMLLMYWFGRIVGDFVGNHRVLPIYLIAGLAGNIVYFITANLLPIGGGGISYALGASGAVMGIIVASGMISPNYGFHLILLGEVKLKYIVATLVFLDLIGIAGIDNTGGHFAHLGGALFGGIFVWQLRQGSDWSVPVNNLLESIENFFRGLGRGRNKSELRVDYRNPQRPKTPRSRKGNSVTDDHNLSHQERLDAILDKIKKSGYNSLDEEEKEFLFKASKK